ncbi:hypothetical protein QBC46DRAFT_373787 [Diplogelasinospora grovesii]|uniref:Uncharacterized protein n=1 Tax=Diplogelasinospora grovesii TaxID=303347 RepID=A0AAN6NJ16_9PEZI|nr:hypothetical protein QBC46DRAFT_373787 [Diplogelasinospora grovesii]
MMCGSATTIGRPPQQQIMEAGNFFSKFSRLYLICKQGQSRPSFFEDLSLYYVCIVMWTLFFIRYSSALIVLFPSNITYVCKVAEPDTRHRRYYSTPSFSGFLCYAGVVSVTRRLCPVCTYFTQGCISWRM